MNTITPKISVVIPVKNGATWLDACIKGIMTQTLFGQTEIIAIDSGSTDDSLKVLSKYPVRIYHVSPDEFNHGLTRQYGAELSRGEYVVMTVQDAMPFDELWLQRLLLGFKGAENVAGVCGSQVVPHDPDKNPVEWYRPVDEPKMKVYQYKTPQEFHDLIPLHKMWACGWDDVTAIYRRDVLMQIPFRKTSFGEDAIWAKDALLAGYALVYNPAAKVYHYHYEDIDYCFRRNLTVMYLRYKQFGCIYNRPTQSLRQQLKTIKTLLISKPLTWRERWNWYWYNQEQFRGRLKAYEVFTAALAESEAKLDAVHEELCGKPPVHQIKPSDGKIMVAV